MKIEFSTQLVELRKNKELSQEFLAEELNVSRQAISKWERGEAFPDLQNSVSLANVLGVSLDELILGSDSQSQLSTKTVKHKFKVDYSHIYLLSFPLIIMVEFIEHNYHIGILSSTVVIRIAPIFMMMWMTFPFVMIVVQSIREWESGNRVHWITFSLRVVSILQSMFIISYYAS